MAELKLVSIQSIRENPVALRGVNVESEEYVGLVDSISKVGILSSLSVRKRTETVGDTVVEYYELVDGLHRYTAAVAAGLSEVPVSIVDLDKVEVLEAQLMANIHKIETTAVEYTKQLQRIFALNPTMTISDMATRVAKSPSWVQQRLNLLKLEKSIQDLVDGGKITVANAVALSKLPPEEQLLYVDQAMTMNTDEFVPTIQARAKELKDAAREGRASKPVEFVPVAKVRKTSELKAEFDSPGVGPELCNRVGVSTAADGFALAIAYVLSLDPVSVEQQVAADKEKKQSKEEAKKRRAAERAKKRAEEAAEKAAELSEAVN